PWPPATAATHAQPPPPPPRALPTPPPPMISPTRQSGRAADCPSCRCHVHHSSSARTAGSVIRRTTRAISSSPSTASRASHAGTPTPSRIARTPQLEPHLFLPGTGNPQVARPPDGLRTAGGGLHLGMTTRNG